MAYIGIDLGGISIAAALVSEQGEILSRRSCPTPKGPDSVADAIAGHVKSLLEATHEPVPYIGIGSPGTIDPESGVVEYWSNLDFRHVPLAEMIQERTGLPALLENDANCAALGEYVAGAGKGSKSLVVITLGTGIGGPQFPTSSARRSHNLERIGQILLHNGKKHSPPDGGLCFLCLV